MGPHAGTCRNHAGDSPGNRSLSIRRSRRAAAVGTASVAVGGLLGLWIATITLLPVEAVQGYPSRTTAVGFVGGLQVLDERLFVFLNSLGSERWDRFWLFVTHKLTWIPLYAALLYLVHRQYGARNLLIVVALIVAMITLTDQLANLFKHVFERPRPCREEHLEELIRYIAPRCGRYGYFSAHAGNSTAFAVFLGLLLRKSSRNPPLLLLLLLLWASTVGFSRIYVGVHYPLDTLTGMAIGAMVGVLFFGLARRLEPVRTL